MSRPTKIPAGLLRRVPMQAGCVPEPNMTKIHKRFWIAANGKDDYSLNVANLPQMAPAEPARIPSGNGSRAARRARDQMALLMRSPEVPNHEAHCQLHQQPAQSPSAAAESLEIPTGSVRLSRSKRRRPCPGARGDTSRIPHCHGFRARLPVPVLRACDGRRQDAPHGRLYLLPPPGRSISHFFVLAPNLTIYNKLFADFTPNTPKYVFQGIAEFANNPPEIVTGDNYESGRGVRKADLFGEIGVHINIFNISKINSEVRAAGARASSGSASTLAKAISNTSPSWTTWCS